MRCSMALCKIALLRPSHGLIRLHSIGMITGWRGVATPLDSGRRLEAVVQ